MQISLSEWTRFRDRMFRLSKTAGDQLMSFINKGGGYANMDPQNVISYAYGLIQKYGEGSATLAAEMYDAITRLEGLTLPPAEAAEMPTYGEVAEAIGGAAKVSVNEEVLGGVAGRLVKQIGADTLLKNAVRDKAEAAWIPSGDTCAYCISLAAKGWGAVRKDHAEHIHANCDCMYAIRHTSETSYQDYDPARYERMYYGADGKTAKEKINYMRRQAYADNREKILAQKRDAYQKRKELNSSEAEEVDV